jgi:hypothetical protein
VRHRIDRWEMAQCQHRVYSEEALWKGVFNQSQNHSTTYRLGIDIEEGSIGEV